MSYFFKRKKQQKPLVNLVPQKGWEDVVKSKFVLDQLKIRLSAAQLPGWGVKIELKCPKCNSEEVNEKERVHDEYTLRSKCECNRCGFKWEQAIGKESEASEMFRQDTLASFFHGEIGEVFKMSPQAHRAYSRLYRKMLHAEQTYGADSKYTIVLRKALFYAYALCLDRCVRKEHTTPQVVGMPPEIMLPWMRGGMGGQGFYDNLELGLIKPGGVKPSKDEDIKDGGEE